MKKLIYIVLLISLTTFAQTKKLEVMQKETGKTILFEVSQRVKIITESRKKHVGNISNIDSNSITINGINIILDDLSSIKNFPQKGRTVKNIIIGTGMGLIATSGMMGATGNGNAFTIFSLGAVTTVVGGLMGNKNKTYFKRNNTFKIID